MESYQPILQYRNVLVAVTDLSFEVQIQNLLHLSMLCMRLYKKKIYRDYNNR